MISAAPAAPVQKTASTIAAGRPIANKRSIIRASSGPEGGATYDAEPAALQAACPPPRPARSTVRRMGACCMRSPPDPLLRPAAAEVAPGSIAWLFVEPDVFHAPAVEDAVGHDRQAL